MTILFFHRGDNEVDLDGGFEENLAFEAQATKPLRVQASRQAGQSTVTKVASTTLRSNFIFVDGKVSF